MEQMDRAMMANREAMLLVVQFTTTAARSLFRTLFLLRTPSLPERAEKVGPVIAVEMAAMAETADPRLAQRSIPGAAPCSFTQASSPPIAPWARSPAPAVRAAPVFLGFPANRAKRETESARRSREIAARR